MSIKVQNPIDFWYRLEDCQDEWFGKHSHVIFLEFDNGAMKYEVYEADNDPPRPNAAKRALVGFFPDVTDAIKAPQYGDGWIFVKDASVPFGVDLDVIWKDGSSNIEGKTMKYYSGGVAPVDVMMWRYAREEP